MTTVLLVGALVLGGYVVLRGLDVVIRDVLRLVGVKPDGGEDPFA